MTKKNIITFILCSLMLSQAFAGCKSKQSETPSANKPVTPAASEAGPLYPIPGNVTLKVWMPISTLATKHIQSYADNEAFMQAMKDTGVKLDFIHPASGQETEQFNLLIASQDFPDIAFDNKYKGGVSQGVSDGVFEDLTALVPKYAPDYNKLLKDNAEFRREVTTADGKINAFYIYKDVKASVEGEYNRTQFRQDWLDEFKMDIPKTFDQYEAYFKKVLETKPGVAPFVLPKSGQEKQLLAAFGLSTGYFLKDGKVTWFGANPEYKDYLTLLNKWYKAGYISKDFTTIPDLVKFFLAGKSASFIGLSINTFQGAKEIGMKVVTGPYIRQKEGQKLHASYTLFPKNSDSYNGVVFASSKHKPEAVKFINYGYSELGWRTYQYGVKDKSWTMGSDGQPKYTDYILSNPKYSITDVDFLLRLHTGIPRLRDSDRMSIPSNMKDPETLNYRLKWADDPDADAAAILPPFVLTPEDNTKRANIMNDINTYVNEMTLKFITGAEPLTNFDKYMQTIKSMNVDEAISITQKAYDAHMKK